MKKPSRTMTMEYSSIEERIYAQLKKYLSSLRAFKHKIDNTMKFLNKEVSGPITIGDGVAQVYLSDDKVVIETNNDILSFPYEDFKLNFSSYAKNAMRRDYQTDLYLLEQFRSMMTIKVKN